MNRALMIFVVTLIFPALARCAEDAPSPLDPARHLARSGDYSAAIASFERVRDEQPESITPLDGDQFGAVYAWAGDWDGVREHARWMFERFPLPQLIEDAERTAKGYLVYPESNDPGLAARALTLTTFAAENAEGEWVNWFYTAHALALYRNGKYQKSITWAKKTFGDKDSKLSSFALPVQAMSQHALGNTETARKLLRQAESEFAKLPKPGTPKFAESWSDILTARSVLEEARRRLK